MSESIRDEVEAQLKAVIDPHTGKDLVTAKAVKNITVDAAASPSTSCWATRRRVICLS